MLVYCIHNIHTYLRLRTVRVSLWGFSFLNMILRILQTLIECVCFKFSLVVLISNLVLRGHCSLTSRSIGNAQKTKRKIWCTDEFFLVEKQIFRKQKVKTEFSFLNQNRTNPHVKVNWSFDTLVTLRVPLPSFVLCVFFCCLWGWDESL